MLKKILRLIVILFLYAAATVVFIAGDCHWAVVVFGPPAIFIFVELFLWFLAFLVWLSHDEE